MKNLFVSFVAASLLASCTNFQEVQHALGTPTQVQLEIAILGAIAKPHIPADAQTKIHSFATALQSTANTDLSALFALIPTTGSQNADALISAAKAYLTAVVQKYGENNQTTLAYMKAVANGLLANF